MCYPIIIVNVFNDMQVLLYFFIVNFLFISFTKGF